MHSTAETALGNQKSSRTNITGDAWIRQAKQHLGTHKSSTN